MIFSDFVGGSYTLGSVTAACQQSVNLYPELVETGGEKNRYRFVGTPGLELFADLANIHAAATPIRGLWSGAGRLFVAAGTKFMEIDQYGALVGSVHTIADDSAHSPVQVFSNGTQLFVVSAGLGYCDNGGGAGPIAITLSPSGDALTAVTGAFIDGYFIAHRGLLAGDSWQFNISKLGDGTSWDDTDYNVKSGNPDHLIGIHADHGELWLFGSEKTEIHRDTGDADFPFQRDPSGDIHYGLIAPWSPVSIGGAVAWLGSDSRGGTVAYIAEGFAPQRVSTHAVEEAWRTAPFAMSAAVSFAYEDNGHWFWVIVLDGLRTWVYDLTSKLWHERAFCPNGDTLLSTRYKFHQFLPEWASSARHLSAASIGEHIVGDYQDGKLYKMSLDYWDDAGKDILRVRSAPHLTNEQKKTAYHRAQIDMEVGPSIGGDAPPVVAWDWSNDGGQNYAKPRYAGDIRASSSTRVDFRQLGAGRDRVYRLRVRGKTKVAINNAYLNLDQGDC